MNKKNHINHWNIGIYVMRRTNEPAFFYIHLPEVMPSTVPSIIPLPHLSLQLYADRSISDDVNKCQHFTFLYFLEGAFIM